MIDCGCALCKAFPIVPTVGVVHRNGLLVLSVSWDRTARVTYPQSPEVREETPIFSALATALNHRTAPFEDVP